MISRSLPFDDALLPYFRGRVLGHEGQLLSYGSGPAREMGHRLGATLREATRSLLAEYEYEIGMEPVREPLGLAADYWVGNT